MELSVMKLHPDAKLPTFAHETDAGMDMYALEDTIIYAGAHARVKTGIALGIPRGYVGLCWDKSGLAHTSGITVLAGVIDAGYTGEVLVELHNVSDIDYSFAAGDKITQILIQRVEHPSLVEVTTLGETERGEKGFGSSGN